MPPANCVPTGGTGAYTCTMAAWPDRAYDVRIPATYDGVTPLPVLLVLHGGGGNREIARRTSCPGGVTSSPECLENLAAARGYVVVTPDGTGAPILPERRTWNAGGGTGGWQCISAYACNQHIDEGAYFNALLEDLSGVVRFNAARVFATGFSNGAALTHRLACELPNLIAGIAPVAGENQWATSQPCTSATPILDIHGTADPCWPFDGGAMSCADTNPGVKISVTESLTAWLTRNGCNMTRTTTQLPDTTADGTTVLRHQYDCPAGHDVVFHEITGGGHTWPSGYSVNPNGPISTDFSANQVMLDFFSALP